MALTPSTMMPLGTAAPDFNLPDPKTGKVVSLGQVKGEKATVVLFISNHCPFVIHIAEGLAALANHYLARGIGFVAIGSNDAQNYPMDGPEMIAKHGYPFPYLFDESQSVAKAYDAACTPDIFVFDAEMNCAYRGQFDSARPGNNMPVTGADLKSALDRLIAGEPVQGEQIPSIGCNIKWK